MAEETKAYIFTAAENAYEAADQVDRWLEDNWDREFYRRYDVERDDVHAVLDMDGSFFYGKRSDVDNILRSQRKEAETANASGDKSMEGKALRNISDILLESMCPDMPWFNMERYDWKVPDEDDEKHLMGNDRWFAVMVKFYY
jgi:hypothetical protein